MFPDQQVRVSGGEFFPISRAGTGKALIRQKKVRAGDRLVIAVGLAMARSKSLQSGGEPFQRFQNRVGLQIGERQPDVVFVVKFSLADSASFEALD